MLVLLLLFNLMVDAAAVHLTTPLYSVWLGVLWSSSLQNSCSLIITQAKMMMMVITTMLSCDQHLHYWRLIMASE